MVAEEDVSYDDYWSELADFRAGLSHFEPNLAPFPEEIRGDRPETAAASRQLETRLAFLLLAGQLFAI